MKTRKTISLITLTLISNLLINAATDSLGVQNIKQLELNSKMELSQDSLLQSPVNAENSRTTCLNSDTIQHQNQSNPFVEINQTGKTLTIDKEVANDVRIYNAKGELQRVQLRVKGSKTMLYYQALKEGLYTLKFRKAGQLFKYVISVKENAESGLTVYQKPNAKQLIIKKRNSADQILKVEMYDADGNVVLTQTNSNEIDISNTPRGIYTLRISTQLEGLFICNFEHH